MEALSEERRKILDFITEYSDMNGYPPTVREIGAAMGLRSPSTVHSHIRILREQGYLDRNGKSSRGLVIKSRPGFKSVPVLGTVRAGAPILAQEEICGYVPYSTKSTAEHFALNVRGDSMINAGILDGDIVIVRRQDEAKTSEIVVALIDDEATVKRLSIRKNGVWLLPENPAYMPINGEKATILGKVVALFRGKIK